DELRGEATEQANDQGEQETSAQVAAQQVHNPDLDPFGGCLLLLREEWVRKGMQNRPGCEHAETDHRDEESIEQKATSGTDQAQQLGSDVICIAFRLTSQRRGHLV